MAYTTKQLEAAAELFVNMLMSKKPVTDLLSAYEEGQILAGKDPKGKQKLAFVELFRANVERQHKERSETADFESIHKEVYAQLLESATQGSWDEYGKRDPTQTFIQLITTSRDHNSGEARRTFVAAGYQTDHGMPRINVYIHNDGSLVVYDRESEKIFDVEYEGEPERKYRRIREFNQAAYSKKQYFQYAGVGLYKKVNLGQEFQSKSAYAEDDGKTLTVKKNGFIYGEPVLFLPPGHYEGDLKPQDIDSDDPAVLEKIKERTHGSIEGFGNLSKFYTSRGWMCGKGSTKDAGILVQRPAQFKRLKESIVTGLGKYRIVANEGDWLANFHGPSGEKEVRQMACFTDAQVQDMLKSGKMRVSEYMDFATVWPMPKSNLD